MWILNCGGRFPCGVFETREQAEIIISKYKLDATLTKYPLNEIVFDWAIDNGYFTVKSDRQKTKSFIGSFTTAFQEHYHYNDGKDLQGFDVPISVKGMSKLEFQGVDYFWSIKKNCSDCSIIYIMSADKKAVFTYDIDEDANVSSDYIRELLQSYFDEI